ncbi:MAG: endolytic transglycosylase MltG [Patescibacteria group bacterium]
MRFRFNKYKKIMKWPLRVFYIIGAIALILVVWEVYIPVSLSPKETIVYSAKKGMGDDEIAIELQKLGIIKSNYFFRGYVILTLQHSKLQAGKYTLSSSMSTAQIIKKFVSGDVIKQTVTIPEGWDLADIKKYFKENKILNEEEFTAAVKKDFSNEFSFLKDKPEDMNLEGYFFPDTYQVSEGESTEDIFKAALLNFRQKLTPDLRTEIAKQEKSVFEIITMASIIEKEVKSLNEKKIVSGILWKRLSVGMPLQVDATINYITGKNDPGVAIKDTKIDSPYNTYKYKGLPKGPISNPGLDSIIAAIYPKQTKYWFYLTNGRTIFSETLLQHNAARY